MAPTLEQQWDDNVHHFLSTESALSMLILKSSTSSQQQQQQLIDTLKDWPHDIEWRCGGRRACANLLETLAQFRTEQIVKYNHEDLWYQSRENPSVIYQRRALPYHAPFLLGADLTVYVNVPWCECKTIIANGVCHLLGTRQRVIVELVVRNENDKREARELIQ